MAQKTRAELTAEIPIHIKSLGAVSTTKTTGDDLREIIKDMIDSMKFRYEGIPVGGIIMWSGTTSNIPQYYVLCDGTNNTPNLVDKFVRGRGTGTTIFSGGSDTNTLGINNLPVHRHSVNLAVPEHRHRMFVDSGVPGFPLNGNPERYVRTKAYDIDDDAFDYVMGAAYESDGPPTLGWTGPTATGNVTGNTGDVGSGVAVNNLPTYYSLAYIMYVGPSDGSDIVPPTEPVVSNNTRIDGIDVTWTPSYDASGISEYRILLDDVQIGTTLGNVLSYSISTQMVEGVPKTVKVIAVDNHGNQSSPGVSIAQYIPYVPIPSLAIDIPSKTKYTLTVKILIFEEDKPFINSAKIYRSTTSSGPWTFIGEITNLNTAPDPKLIATGLTPNTSYYFYGTGHNITGGNSSNSPIVWSTTKP